jgi:probable phosphoglycerate mutase
VSGIERIIDANPSRRVEVVCHGGIINSYLGHILGIEDLMWFQPTYTSIARVLASSRGHRQIDTLNERGHLALLERA